MMTLRAGRASSTARSCPRTSRRSRTSTTTRATPTRTSPRSPQVNAETKTHRPDLRRPEGQAGLPSSASTSSATPRPATRSSAASCASTRASSSPAPACAAARSASPRSASSRPSRSPTSRQRRRPRGRAGRGEGEGHRHLPGRPRLLQRRELHLHGADLAEQLPRLGPERLRLRAARPACGSSFSCRSSTRTSSTRNFIFSADLYRIAGGLPRLHPRLAPAATSTLGYHLLRRRDGQRSRTRCEYVQVEAGQRLERRSRSPTASAAASPASLRLSLTWDRRDNRLFPTKGFMLFGSAEFAPRSSAALPASRATPAYARALLPAAAGHRLQDQRHRRLHPAARTAAAAADLRAATTWAASTPCAATSCAPSAPPSRGRPPPTGPTPPVAATSPSAATSSSSSTPSWSSPSSRRSACAACSSTTPATPSARNERFFQDRQDDLPARPVPLGGLRLPLVLAHRPAALRVGHPAQPGARRTSRPFEFTIGNFF